MKDTEALALEKFLDLVYFGEVSLVRLKRNKVARKQFLDFAKAELNEVVFQLLKVDLFHKLTIILSDMPP